MARPASASMRDCNSQLSPRAESSVISANISSQSSSCEQVRKARRPSCSTTRSSSSAKPSSASALSSARREATSNVVTCRRRPLSAGSFSAIEFPPHQAPARRRDSMRCSVAATKNARRPLTGPALAAAVETGVAVDADVDHEAEAEHHGEHRRTAIGNQRQRHPDDRDQPHHHPRVDENVKKEIADDPETQEAAEMVAASECDRKAVDDDQRVESEEPEPADEAELFGQGGKDEVGLLLRQKAQMALAAVQKALAKQPAGAECDL